MQRFQRISTNTMKVNKDIVGKDLSDLGLMVVAQKVLKTDGKISINKCRWFHTGHSGSLTGLMSLKIM